VFQPIVTLPSAQVVAYEVLGRGQHPSLPKEPRELLRIAESVGLAADLSQVFRRTAVELVKQADKKPPLLFLNTHPTEIGTLELVESLVQLRQTAPDLDFVLEIHEGSVAETELIAELKTTLEELGIALAYDHFGLGERFLQLADVAPDYLKFDIRIAKKIVAASPAERRMLSTLVDATREMGSLSIAGGVETQMEAEACRSLGFQWAQGYMCCEPLTLDQMGPDGAPLEVISKSAR
jgi:EAL domain-containing protein (putative c-di-GMP-specific phosphodiesterase class I)